MFNNHIHNTTFNFHPFVRPGRIVLAFLLFLIVTNKGISQINSSLDLQKKFESYNENHLQEKLYVRTDKNFYIAGEVCWFKIYDVDAFFHRPLDISKVAYIEILDKNNKPVLQTKVALKKGDGNGSLYLPFTLLSGKYNFRAYTNWMKNSGADYFFEKTITIVNGRITPPNNTTPSEKADIAFFPEGGNLVNGLQSKLAFHAVNQYGKGIKCDGIITNEREDTIATFKTSRFGIGNFLFTPGTGHSYKALVSLPNGARLVKQLPTAYNDGYVMMVSKAEDSQVKINVQSANKNDNISLFLFAHTRGSVKNVLSGKIQNGNIDFVIDAKKLGDGISHFTVFNEAGQPLCERLYFKYPVQNLELEASTDKSIYDLRKKINLQISSLGNDAKLMPANLSMAVYRFDSLNNFDGTNISNYLWLSSDLSGDVESPSYYFTDDSGVTEAMDNLMLTQGWRRFRWEDVLQNKKPSFTFLPEYNGHIINGKVTQAGTEQPGKFINEFLSVPGTQTLFRTAVSDSTGHIKFEMKNYYGSREIIVQPEPTDSLYRIEISNPFYDKYSGRPAALFTIQEKNAAALLNNYLETEVQTTFSGNKIQQLALLSTDTSAFYYKADMTYMLDDYVRFTTMEEVLREYVWPVNVLNKNGHFSLRTFDEVTRAPFLTNPLVLLDGVPVFDITGFMNKSTANIRKLEVMTRRYYYGNVASEGIVNITSYLGNLPDYQLDPHATVLDYDGLQLQREFFSPVYETEKEIASRMPDFRNLLFWSPNVITNESGKKDLDFYSSDIPGKYVIVLEGLTADGKTGSKLMFFEVKAGAK